LHGLLQRLKSGRVLLDELPVFQSIPQDHMKHAHQQGKIRPGTHRQKEIRISRDRIEARIRDDQFAAAIAAAPDIVGCNRRAVANVRTDDKQYIRFGNVAPRNRTAIYAESKLVRDPGRYHAQAPVVIDMARTDCKAGKFSNQIRFFRREGSAAVNSYGVFAVFLLNFANAPGCELECFGPIRLAKTSAIRRYLFVAQQRIEKAVRVAPLQIAFHAFGAELAFVKRKLLPGLETNHAVLTNL